MFASKILIFLGTSVYHRKSLKLGISEFFDFSDIECQPASISSVNSVNLYSEFSVFLGSSQQLLTYDV